MKHRRKLAIMFVVVLVLIGVGFAFFARAPREPMHKGRTVSSWLDQALMANDPVSWHNVHTNAVRLTDEQTQVLRDEARAAIEQIGTNAIPTLLRKVATRDTKFKRFIANQVRPVWVGRMGFGEAYRRYLFEYVQETQEGFLGFEFLGASASNAVPELVSILRNNDNLNSRRAAAYSLRFIGPPARAAIPDLVLALKDPIDLVRDPAAQALFSIAYDRDKPNGWRPECTAVLVPALAEALKDPQTDVIRVLHLLDDMQRIAKPAVPAIVPFASSPDAKVRAAAEHALRSIDPEGAAKSGK